MGWCSGGALAENLWKDIESLIPKENHRKVAQAFIKRFEDEDCDVMEETVLWDIAGYRETEEHTCDNCCNHHRYACADCSDYSNWREVD